MGLAAGLSAFVGYAVINSMPSFLVRSFGMGLASVGFWLGLICGVAGGAGFFFGGYIADRLGRSGQRRALRFLTLSMLVGAVANGAVFLSTSAIWCLALFVVPMIIANFYLAPVFAFTQGLVPLRMRSVASAIILLVVNAIGLALGPLCAGMLSDLLKPMFQAESLRYSLLIVCVAILPWAAWHYHRAARSIEADLARATELD
jgi:MFS family permease